MKMIIFLRARVINRTNCKALTCPFKTLQRGIFYPFSGPCILKLGRAGYEKGLFYPQYLRLLNPPQD